MVSLAFTDCSLKVKCLVYSVLAHAAWSSFPLILCMLLSGSTVALLTICNQGIPKSSASKFHPRDYLLSAALSLV